MSKDLKNQDSEAVSVERIESSIQLLRGQKVMLDRDLAGLYGVTTSYLKRAVRRNRNRFPEDFMFPLTSEEANFLTDTCVESTTRTR